MSLIDLLEAGEAASSTDRPASSSTSRSPHGAAQNSAQSAPKGDARRQHLPAHFPASNKLESEAGSRSTLSRHREGQPPLSPVGGRANSCCLLRSAVAISSPFLLLDRTL